MRRPSRKPRKTRKTRDKKKRSRPTARFVSPLTSSSLCSVVSVPSVVSSAEILAVALLIARVAEQVVQLGPRQHLGDAGALVAVPEEVGQRVAGGAEGHAEGR